MRGVGISMAGKGRWQDNVYVERLWRSPEQEEVYRCACESVSETKKESPTTCATSTKSDPYEGGVERGRARGVRPGGRSPLAPL